MNDKSCNDSFRKLLMHLTFKEKHCVKNCVLCYVIYKNFIFLRIEMNEQIIASLKSNKMLEQSNFCFKSITSDFT